MDLEEKKKYQKLREEYPGEFHLAEKITDKLEVKYTIKFSQKEQGYIKFYLVGKWVLKITDSQKIPSEISRL